MQQNPENRTVPEKKPAERRTIEVIVGRKPESGEAEPEKIRKIDETLNVSEVGGRGAYVNVESPYSHIIYTVYLEYEGEWFYESRTGLSFQVWY